MVKYTWISWCTNLYFSQFVMYICHPVCLSSSARNPRKTFSIHVNIDAEAKCCTNLHCCWRHFEKINVEILLHFSSHFCLLSTGYMYVSCSTTEWQNAEDESSHHCSLSLGGNKWCTYGWFNMKFALTFHQCAHVRGGRVCHSLIKELWFTSSTWVLPTREVVTAKIETFMGVMKMKITK